MLIKFETNLKVYLEITRYLFRRDHEILIKIEYKLKFTILKQRKFTVNHAILKYIIVFKRFNFIKILYIKMV